MMDASESEKMCEELMKKEGSDLERKECVVGNTLGKRVCQVLQ